MSHIFISYSRKDIDFASKIVQALAENNLDTWIDWKSIPKGEDWEQEIYRGVEEADAFLFLISLDSASSKMCNKEIAHAVKNGKRILPIYISNINVDEVNKAFLEDKSREEISRRNYIFCRDRLDDFEKAIEEIRNTIHTDFEWLTYQRELQVKALKWGQKKDTSRLLRGKELREGEQQLAEINNKADPQPTKLQREYVLASRRNEEQQRRQIIIGMSLGLIILTILSVFAWTQRNEAKSQQAIAQAASTRAIAQESIAKTNEAEAKRQTNIAIARQLVANAQPLFTNGNSKQMISVLLAIQSMHVYPTGEAAQILQNNTLAYPISLNVHNIWVSSVAFSPNGKYVVSGGCDKQQFRYIECTQGSARVWEATTGKEITHMIYENSEVTTVAFSPDGKFVVSGGDISARVWDAFTGKEIARMTHNFGVNSVAFSPDGRYVISGGCDELNSNNKCVDGTARLWDATTGKEITHFTHNDYLNSVAISPDGRYVVSGSSDFTARVWDAYTGEEIARTTHDDIVRSVAFSPDGSYVVSGGDDVTARVWETLTGKEISRILPFGSVVSVAFSPDGKYVVSGNYDNTARVWDAMTGKEIARMTHGNFVNFVAFSLDGKYVISASEDNTARVWEIIPNSLYNQIIPTLGGEDNITYSLLEAFTEKEIARITHDNYVNYVAFSPDGKYVVSGSIDGTARVWEVTKRKEVLNMTHYGYVSSPDGKYTVSAWCDRMNEDTCTRSSVHVIEVATGKEIAHTMHEGIVNSIAFSPDGRYVVSGGYTIARVWETLTGNEISQVSFDKIVCCVAFSPDGNYVASGSDDNTARVWEASTGKEIARMTYDGDVSSVAFSPDGDYVVAGSMDDTARVWEAMTGKEIARMIHGSGVSSVAFSPDGDYVISGSFDKTARVWNTFTGLEIARMIHEDIVRSVSFSPDGSYVVSMDNKNADQKWIWRPKDLITEACSRVTRNLTRAEWDQYIGDALPYQGVCSNLPIEAESTPVP